MWLWIYKMASPKTCYRYLKILQPYFAALCLLAFVYGVLGGFLMAPADYQQGDVFRLMYLHVPAAICSLAVYLVMSFSVVLFFVWKIKIADMLAKASAPIGATFTIICLITGMIWGRPTWGTWWIWDARLTSELLLLFIYFGVMALRSAMPNVNLAARVSGIFVLIGLINIPIIHYSVNWWNTLHQGASLSLASASIAPSMLHPLIAMIFAFLFYYAWSLCARVRLELLLREEETVWVKEEIEFAN